MFIKLTVAALLALAGAADEELPKLPPETMGLVDQARALPAEFSADLLLKLAASPVIPDARWKHRLIEDAFEAGAHAQLPYVQKGGYSTDSYAFRSLENNGLEALTLQTRAVEAMMQLDLPRARALFEEMGASRVLPVACNGDARPDVSAYYATAAKLFERAFTPEEREKRKDLIFLERLAGAMDSPAQAPPLERLIFTTKMPGERRLELVSAFAGALAHVNGPPRVFGASMFQLVPVSPPPKMPEGVRALPPLIESSAHGEVPSEVAAAATALLPALREYIVRHAKGSRCSDQKGPLRAVTDFNYLAAKLDPAAGVYKPISDEEAKPDSDAGTFQPREWWNSKRSKEVLSALKWLNHGNRPPLPGTSTAQFWTEEERQSTEWGAHFTDTLKLIEGWKEEEEITPEDWFGMVSDSYQLLAAKAPSGERREAAMTRFLNFMETRYASTASHNFWFTQLHNLWRSADPWVLERFSGSSNPVIAAYTKIQQAVSKK
jgi:hypothetical protein